MKLHTFCGMKTWKEKTSLHLLSVHKQHAQNQGLCIGSASLKEQRFLLRQQPVSSRTGCAQEAGVSDFQMQVPFPSFMVLPVNEPQSCEELGLPPPGCGHWPSQRPASAGPSDLGGSGTPADGSLSSFSSGGEATGHTQGPLSPRGPGGKGTKPGSQLVGGAGLSRWLSRCHPGA